MPTNATRLSSPLHRIFFIRIINWNRERKLWMSHLNISFADRGMMPSSLFRDSESISISKSWLPSMVCVLPDPVCPYAMMHTLYLFSQHTISSIKCSKIHTASSACLNDNKHYWLHIEDIQVKQKYIFFNFGNSPCTRPNYFGSAHYWWSSSCSLLSCWKTGESKAVPWERRLDNRPVFGKWPHALLPNRN